MINPDGVYAGYQNVVNIPWDEPVCGATDFAKLSDYQLRTSVDWKAWEKYTVIVKNAEMCGNVLWEETLTLRQAVLKCTTLECEGILWLQAESSSVASSTTSEAWGHLSSEDEEPISDYSPLGDDYPVNLAYHFTGCGVPTGSTPTSAPPSNTASSTLSSSPDVYRGFWKDLDAPAPSDGALELLVDFYRSGYAGPHAEGVLNESGLVFEHVRDKGYSYGWCAPHGLSFLFVDIIDLYAHLYLNMLSVHYVLEIQK